MSSAANNLNQRLNNQRPRANPFLHPRQQPLQRPLPRRPAPVAQRPGQARRQAVGQVRPNVVPARQARANVAANANVQRPAANQPPPPLANVNPPPAVPAPPPQVANNAPNMPARQQQGNLQQRANVPIANVVPNANAPANQQQARANVAPANVVPAPHPPPIRPGGQAPPAHVPPAPPAPPAPVLPQAVPAPPAAIPAHQVHQPAAPVYQAPPAAVPMPPPAAAPQVVPLANNQLQQQQQNQQFPQPAHQFQNQAVAPATQLDNLLNAVTNLQGQLPMDNTASQQRSMPFGSGFNFRNSRIYLRSQQHSIGGGLSSNNRSSRSVNPLSNTSRTRLQHQFRLSKIKELQNQVDNLRGEMVNQEQKDLLDQIQVSVDNMEQNIGQSDQFNQARYSGQGYDRRRGGVHRGYSNNTRM